MQLRYVNSLGKTVELQLEERPLAIGRSNDVDIQLQGEKVSRRHAEVRYWGGDYVIKDLKSRNGTLVNDQRVDVARLEPGDRISIGGNDVFFEEYAPRAPNTIIRQIGEEMAEEGKGYKTMLRALVQDADGHPDKKP